MKVRFISELIIGLVIIVSVVLFGEAGIIAIALIALFPIILRFAKIKGDEREMLIHYKTGNISFGLTIISVVIIYYLQNISIGDFTVESVWMQLTIGSIIFFHGAAGLFVLYNE